MANTVQAAKRAKQAEQRRGHNASFRSMVRTYLKKVVAATKPDFFWVGLSTPKQERFMAENLARLGLRAMLGGTLATCMVAAVAGVLVASVGEAGCFALNALSFVAVLVSLLLMRRTSAPPAMVAFDAPRRAVCISRRERTDSPLQAFILLNGVQYVEAARGGALS